MPRRAASGEKGLIKHHRPNCKNRENPRRCKCSWSGAYGGYDVVLSKWARIEIDPRSADAATRVFTRMKQAIDDDAFNPEGERRSQGSGQTFADYIADWWADYVVERDLSTDSLGPVIEVIKASEIGSMTLASMATPQAVEAIEGWLSARRKKQKWSGKTFNEYLGLLRRLLDRAVTRRRIPYNPARAIERMKGVSDNRGELRHVRIDEDIEDRLLAACEKLNRTQSPNNNKLTQPKADAIRARVEAGEQQKALAAEYGVSPAVVCAIVKGTIWNPARRVTTSVGDMMKIRLLMALYGGPRAGELLDVQIQHVDWKNGVQVPDPSGKGKFTSWEIILPAKLTKGGKTTGEDQSLYIAHPVLSRLIEARRIALRNRPTAYLFGRVDGGKQLDFDKAARSLFREAGIEWSRKKGQTWHLTRHEFASRVVEKSSDIAKARDLCRHRKVETTQRYVHTRRAALRETVLLLNRA